MSSNTVEVTYVPSKENSNYVILEQDKWDANVNYLTKMGIVGYLNQLLFQDTPLETNCSDGIYRVFAYPYPVDLNYLIGTTHGTLGYGIHEEVEYTEIMQCNLSTSINLKYPSLGIVRFQWIGDAYNDLGDIVNTPTIDIKGQVVSISSPVYGSFFITYKVHRVTYTLSVLPLKEGVENLLQSFVYACWEQANVVMECRFPAGADTNTCNNSGIKNYNINVGPDNKKKCVGTMPKEEYVDYCLNII